MAKLYNSLQEVDITDIKEHIHSLMPKTIEERKEDIRSAYGAISEEVIKENFNEADLLRPVFDYMEKWEDILFIAKNVPEAQYIKSLLDFLGTPSEASQLDIDKQLELKGMKNCMYVRKRYTILRLYDDLGLRVI